MKQTFPALTGIRAIAAFMVFFHHFNPFYGDAEKQPFIGTILNEFHIGVSIFFVLSGFLIYFRYYDLWKEGKFEWYQYIINRIAKIYPAYFLLTTITFLYQFIANEISNYSKTEYFIIYLLNITFLRGFFDSFKFSGIIQGWTLTTEECFYFLAPFIFVSFFKKKWIMSIISIYGFGLAMVFIFRNQSLFGLFKDFNFLFGFTFFGRCFEFFAGMVLAKAISKKSFLLQKNGFSKTLIGIFGIALCTILLALIKLHYNVQQGGYYPLGRIINNWILPFPICIFYYGLIFEKNKISELLSSRLFILLGRASFIFYLIHLGVFYNLIIKLIPFDKYILPFIILNIFSIFLYYKLEIPCNKMIRLLAKKKMHGSIIA
jgi:peptidoglycan/LPS O-acetylase OafA/YrhL